MNVQVQNISIYTQRESITSIISASHLIAMQLFHKMTAFVDLENLDSIVHWKLFGTVMLWVEVKVRG